MVVANRSTNYKGDVRERCTVAHTREVKKVQRCTSCQQAAAGAHTQRNGGVRHGWCTQAAQRGARTLRVNSVMFILGNSGAHLDGATRTGAYRVHCTIVHIQWRRKLFSLHSLECLNDIRTLRTADSGSQKFFSARSHSRLDQISSASTIVLHFIHYSARSRPLFCYNLFTTGLDLICALHVQISSKTRLDLIHYPATFHSLFGQISYSIMLQFIHNWVRSHLCITRLDFIQNQARSHPLFCYISSTTRLDLICKLHGQISSITRLGLIHNLARSHPLSCYISFTTRLDLILYYATIYSQLGQISSVHCTAKFSPILGQISSTTWLDLIHHSASHLILDQIPSTTHAGSHTYALQMLQMFG